MMDRKIVMIAGPNGAGKTTFAKAYLANDSSCRHFVNADLIASGLSPFAADEVAIAAGRLMLKTIDDLVTAGENFALETTLSGLGYLRAIPRWRQKGYEVELIFLQLRDVESAIWRVAERVRQGGHNIPEATIRRRFEAGLRNFHDRYKGSVDSWLHFDNTGEAPVLLDEKTS